MSDDLIRQVRSRYLDLLERSILNSIYGESRLEMAMQGMLQRLRHPYLTRRGRDPLALAGTLDDRCAAHAQRP